MPQCESCGKEFLAFNQGPYCPVCKARIKAAEAEQEYWQNRRLEEEQQELDKVKAQQRLINRAFLDALEKKKKGVSLNATAQYCYICGKVFAGHSKYCLKCGHDDLEELELSASEIAFLEGC